VILDSTKLPTIANPCISTMVFNLHELHHRSLNAFQLIQLHFGDHGSLDKNGYLNKTKLGGSKVINKDEEQDETNFTRVPNQMRVCMF
jgi:hypothetical protein